MLKIESLTQKQIDRFPEFVERWTKIGLSTAPADRPKAESAIREMYVMAGLKPPAQIVWCGSPLSQGITRAIVLDKKMLVEVGASVWDSVWDSVRDSVRDSVYGQHDAGWISFYSYFKETIGLEKQTTKLSGLFSLCESAGWALPHQNICWVSERHNVLVRDERGRLHCLDGPACAYPDGWAIYAVHGVRVPEYIVTCPQEITIEKINSEKNAEVQRVMIERYGEDRYIVDSGMSPVATDERFGDIYLKEVEAGRPIAKIRLVNRSPEPDGSYRIYWLNINAAHYNGDAGRIPQAAVASTWRTKPGGTELFFKDWRDYSPVLET